MSSASLSSRVLAQLDLLALRHGSAMRHRMAVNAASYTNEVAGGSVETIRNAPVWSKWQRTLAGELKLVIVLASLIFAGALACMSFDSIDNLTKSWMLFTALLALLSACAGQAIHLKYASVPPLELEAHWGRPSVLGVDPYRCMQVIVPGVHEDLHDTFGMVHLELAFPFAVLCYTIFVFVIGLCVYAFRPDNGLSEIVIAVALALAGVLCAIFCGLWIRSRTHGPVHTQPTAMIAVQSQSQSLALPTPAHIFGSSIV